MQAELVESSKQAAPRDPARSSPRVLILRAGAIGDTLMATPLVRALRRTFPAAYPPRRPSSENHLMAAQSLGVQPAGADMELYYPGALDETLRLRLARLGIQEGERLVGVHPGWGGRKHPPEDTRLRSWPAHRFADVVRWLSTSARVVLTGGREDRALTNLIARLSGVSCVNLAGELSLLELAALVRRLGL